MKKIWCHQLRHYVVPVRCAWCELECSARPALTEKEIEFLKKKGYRRSYVMTERKKKKNSIFFLKDGAVREVNGEKTVQNGKYFQTNVRYNVSLRFLPPGRKQTGSIVFTGGKPPASSSFIIIKGGAVVGEAESMEALEQMLPQLEADEVWAVTYLTPVIELSRKGG